MKTGDDHDLPRIQAVQQGVGKALEPDSPNRSMKHRIGFRVFHYPRACVTNSIEKAGPQFGTLLSIPSMRIFNVRRSSRPNNEFHNGSASKAVEDLFPGDSTRTVTIQIVESAVKLFALGRC